MHLYHQSESIYDDQGLRNYSLKLRYFYLKFRNTQKIKRNECSVIAGGCSVNAIYEQIFPGVPSRLWDRVNVVLRVPHTCGVSGSLID